VLANVDARVIQLTVKIIVYFRSGESGCSSVGLAVMVLSPCRYGLSSFGFDLEIWLYQWEEEREIE
jgi:hypothetical protein